MADEQEWLDAHQAAEALGVSYRTIIRRVQSGELTPVHRGHKRKFFFSADEIAAKRTIVAKHA